MKTPYRGNVSLDINKFPSPRSPVFGSTKPVRAAPIFKVKTKPNLPNNHTPFDKWQVARQAKRSFNTMVASVSTSKRRHFKYQKKMPTGLEGTKSVYAGGKTSSSESRRALGDEVSGKPPLFQLSTYPQTPTINRQVCFPNLSMSKVLEIPSKPEEKFRSTPKPIFRKQVCFPSLSMLKGLETPAKQEQTFPITPKRGSFPNGCLPVLSIPMVLETPSKQEKIFPVTQKTNLERHISLPYLSTPGVLETSAMQNEIFPNTQKSITLGEDCYLPQRISKIQ